MLSTGGGARGGVGATLVWAQPQGCHAGSTRFLPCRLGPLQSHPAQITGSSVAFPAVHAPCSPSCSTAKASAKGALHHLQDTQKSAMMLTIYSTKTGQRGRGTSPGSAQAPKLTSHPPHKHQAPARPASFLSLSPAIPPHASLAGTPPLAGWSSAPTSPS